ncbi:MAG: VWA domain-containing protein [Chloroflexia bacterium]
MFRFSIRSIFKVRASRGRPNPKVLLFLAATMMCIAAAPAGAGVASAQAQKKSPTSQPAQPQGDRKLTINQVRAGEWPQVTLNMTLEGPDGKAVPEVLPNQFEVREQGQPQSLLGLELGPAKSIPLALVLVMDVSGSMNASGKLGQAKAAASEFLSSIRPEDTAAVVAFNDQVRTVVPLTNNVEQLKAGVDSLQAGGETAIYDALYTSSQLLNGVPANKRRAIVLLTDGADTSSKYGAAVAADVARQTGALVYTIGLGPDPNDGVLTNIADPTGGKYYKAPTPADLGAIYSAISIALDSQLFLKYKSTTQLERSYQLIRIEVKYTGADGKVVTKQIAYRPRVSAALNRAADAEGPAPSAQPPLQVELPSRLRAAEPEAALPMPQAGMMTQFYSMSAGLLAGFAALAATAGVAYLLAPSATSQRVASYVMGEAPITKGERPPGFFSRVIMPALDGLGRRLARFSPKGYTDHVESLLTLTGPPYRMRLVSFLGIQVALSAVLVGVLVIWSLRTSPDTPAQWLLAAILGAVMGFYFPYFWLKRKVTRRQKAVLRALPGALDFLAINVEAGLGFDAAVAQVVQRWHNTLTDELALLLIDFQIGKARKDAWRELMLRTQVPELNTFVTAMLQNEQVGSSIGLLLRTQADQMRVRRRQAAEEAARTAPVKMLLPMVFFIFPGIFVVILGPAIPQFFNTFTNLGK